MSEKTGAPAALTIVGPGRAGNSIAAAARQAGMEVDLLGRSPEPGRLAGRCVLLCVPDAAIAGVAAGIGEAADGSTAAGVGSSPKFIGHTSGATGLDPLTAAGASDGCFSLHPLQTLPDGASELSGAPVAVAGTSPAAESAATGLARALDMLPFAVAEADRATYHAAASVASNFLVTLEQAATTLLGSAGVENPRAVLAPLIRRSLENWIEDGETALTGPIARGDRDTVERHREAIRRSQPGLLPLYDTMAEATRNLAEAAPETTGAGPGDAR